MRVVRDPVKRSRTAPTHKAAGSKPKRVDAAREEKAGDVDAMGGVDHIAPSQHAGSSGGAKEGGASPLSTRLTGKNTALPISQQALQTFIGAQTGAQWFTGKGRVVTRVDVDERAPIQLGIHADATTGAKGARHELALLRVHYEDGGADLYHVPIVIERDGSIKDALEDPAFVRAMVDAVRDGRDVPSSSGAVHARPVAGTSLPKNTTTLKVKAMGVPQSNVSIKVGDDVMFKAYRKPEPGVSIEREVTEHLTRQKYANTPQLLGTLTVDTKRGPMTIGMVFELVKSDGDGWKNVVARLGGKDAGGKELIDGVRLLGTRIGEMHKALGAPVADPAFAPQVVTRDDLATWTKNIARELDETIAAAKKANPALADKLTSARPALLARLDQLKSIDDGAGKKMRIHGDLHLGQVLHRDGDWLALDFEGEPARSKEERRGFYTPLRDVAGMVRSCAYAEAEARRAGHDVPKEWAKTAASAFLDGYRSAVDGLGLTPSDAVAFNALLSAVELEKALYEVRYELVSRPALVDVPASRVLEMATS